MPQFHLAPFLDSLQKRVKWAYLYYLGIVVAIPLLWILVNAMGFLKGMEGLVLSAFYKIRGEIDAPIKLIYIDVDSRAIELMGERPFPRTFYADLVHHLFRYGGAKAIGIDIVFSQAAQSFLADPEKVKLDDASFREVIQANKNLVLAAAYTPKVNVLTSEETLSEFPLIYRGFSDPNTNALPELPSISLIGLSGGLMGLINVDESMPLTALSSWVPLFAKTPGPLYYTLALELFRLSYGLDQDCFEITPDRLYIKNKDGTYLRQIPLTYGQLLEVHWFSKFFSPKNPRYSMADVLGALAQMQTGDPKLQERAFNFFTHFQDATILIGPVDPMLQDLSPTLVDKEPVPRVGIHGNLLKTIASGQYISRLSFFWQGLIIYVVGAIILLQTVYTGKWSLYAKLSALVCMCAYLVGAFYLFKDAQIVVPMIGPLGNALALSFSGLIYKLLQEEKQKSRIKNLFGTYVSPELVSQMVESQEEPQLGGSEAEITAFFSDIQNFSSFSEKLSPAQLVELMNEYLSTMTDILQAEKGTLDKYIGDAIVAMFGAPVPIKDHALRACSAACKIQLKQAQLREKWSRSSLWPSIVHHMHTRIGLNTGLSIVGNMGSKTRFNYTMMGDSVNLAARCESGAKAYGVYTLVTGHTLAALGPNSDMAFRLLDKIIVKGRSQAVEIYELLGFKSELKQSIVDCMAEFEKGFSAYIKGDFLSAITFFEVSSKLEFYQVDPKKGIDKNPSTAFIERCEHLLKEPPEAPWQGIYIMKTK
jgi:adenylate cyclase